MSFRLRFLCKHHLLPDSKNGIISKPPVARQWECFRPSAPLSVRSIHIATSSHVMRPHCLRYLPSYRISRALKTDAVVPFSSSHRVTDERQRQMVEAFEGRFIGPIEVEEFLARFLPTTTGSCPQANFCGVIAHAGSSELLMYDPFVNACSKLAPALEFVNTSANSDPRCVLSGVGLKPDVCVYARTSGRRHITDFSRIEINVEFKSDLTHDAFVDPPPLSDRKQHRFEKDTEIGKDTRGQLIAYASAQMEMQFRAFCFSIQICNRMARLIRWDHAGAIVTSAFDYGRKPELLAQFFWRYNHMDLASRGYDLSVRDADEAHVAETCLKLKIPSGTRIFNLLIPDDALGFNGNPVLVDDYKTRKSSQIPIYFITVPTYRGRCLRGRFTRTFPVYEKSSDRVLLLKDTWRMEHDDLEKEGKVYEALEAARVPYIAKLIQAGDVMAHRTETQNWVSKSCKPDEVMLPHRHYRLVLDAIGTPLWRFNSSFQLVQAIWDAIEAHKVAYEVAGYLHRDISTGNIMIYKGRGLLIDWELAKKKEKLSEDARRRSAIGTWQFISVRLLSDPSKKPELADDLESFFHVVTWVALRFSSHSLPKPLLENFLKTVYDENYVTESGLKLGGFFKSVALGSNNIGGRIRFRLRPKLDSLLRTLAKHFDARYPGIQQVVLCSKRLQSSDWVLEQGRDALQHRDNWPKADKAKRLKELPHRNKRESNRSSALDTRANHTIDSKMPDRTIKQWI